MKISVKVKTKAREELVEKIGENNFSVAVKEPAEKGKVLGIKALTEKQFLEML